MDKQYFLVKIQTSVVDENSGRIKKIKEEKLVKDYTVSGCEAKINKLFEGYSQDWKITSVNVSRIGEVVE